MSSTLFQGKGLLKGKDLVYASPENSSPPEKRTRRKAIRCLSIPTIPIVEAPRTACPRNGSAFSYDPVHLPAWYMPDSLWACLPPRLTSSLSTVQHAGAAAITGFARLESLQASLLDSEFSDDATTALRAAARPRGNSIASTLSSSHGSPASSVNSSMVSTPLTTPALSETAVSPFSLSPFAFECADTQKKEQQTEIARQHRRTERSFSIPSDPHSAYYERELGALRTEALPQLRHAVRVVDRELNEAKRLSELTEPALTEFENWWAGKKAVAMGLDQKGRLLSVQHGIPTTGFGWSA